jgi:hypothetical protein
MSQPIPFRARSRDFREELRVRLEHAPADHAEAILASYEVLQGLHDRGVLELLRGVLGGVDSVLEIAVEAAKTPAAIRGIRNLIIMLKLAGSIDPDQLHAATDGGERGVHSVGDWQADQDGRRPSQHGNCCCFARYLRSGT